MMHRIQTNIKYQHSMEKSIATDVDWFEVTMNDQQTIAPLNTSGGYSSEVKSIVESTIRTNKSLIWAIQHSGTGLYLKKELQAQADFSSCTASTRSNLIRFTFVVYLSPATSTYWNLKFKY